MAETPEAVQVPVAGPENQSPVEKMATIVNEHSSSPMVEAKPEDSSAAFTKIVSAHDSEPQVRMLAKTDHEMQTLIFYISPICVLVCLF
jgi:hypothetical protein